MTRGCAPDNLEATGNRDVGERFLTNVGRQWLEKKVSTR